MTFTGYQPVFHKKGQCSCVVRPCGEVPTGNMRCRACGNAWEDGDVSEYVRPD